MAGWPIYPRPQWLKPGVRAFTLARQATITATSVDSMPAAELLQRELYRRFGARPALRRGPDAPAGSISISVASPRNGAPVQGSLALLGPEAYTLSVTPERAVLICGGPAGALYGAASLAQLFAQEPFPGALPAAPALEVRDWPAHPVRGLHLQLPARHQLPLFRRLLEQAAMLKLNTLFLRIDGGLRYARHPELNTAHARVSQAALLHEGGSEGFAVGPGYTRSVPLLIAGGAALEPEELRDLVAYARTLHLAVVPEVAALGECYYLCVAHPELAERQDDPWPDCTCPAEPRAIELVCDVLDEVLAATEARMVHIGHAGWRPWPACPRCRGMDQAVLLAEHVRRLHEFLAARGVETAMWGDLWQQVIVNGRVHGWPGSADALHRALERLPKDILIIDRRWQLDRYSVEHFSRYGLRVVFGDLHPAGFSDYSLRAQHQAVRGGVAAALAACTEEALARSGAITGLLLAAGMLWWSHYSEAERHAAVHSVTGLVPRLRERLSGRSTPAQAPRPHIFIPFALGPAANAPAPDLMYPNEAAQALAAARRTVAVPFDVPWRPGEGGRPAVVRVSNAQPVSLPVSVNARLESLVFLHCCSLVGTGSGGVLGHYAVRYADSTAELVEIVPGSAIAGWEEPYGYGTAATCYWADPLILGTAPDGRSFTAYRYEWVNPHPDRRILDVRLHHAGMIPDSELILLALTGVAAP